MDGIPSLFVEVAGLLPLLLDRWQVEGVRPDSGEDGSLGLCDGEWDGAHKEAGEDEGGVVDGEEVVVEAVDAFPPRDEGGRGNCGEKRVAEEKARAEDDGINVGNNAVIHEANAAGRGEELDDFGDFLGTCMGELLGRCGRVDGEKELAGVAVDLVGDVEAGGTISNHEDFLVFESERGAELLGVDGGSWVSCVEFREVLDIRDEGDGVVAVGDDDGVEGVMFFFARDCRAGYEMPLFLFSRAYILLWLHVDDLPRELDQMLHLLRIPNNIVPYNLPRRVHPGLLRKRHVLEIHQRSGDIRMKLLIHGRHEHGCTSVGALAAGPGPQRRIGRVERIRLGARGSGRRRGRVVPDAAQGGFGLLLKEDDGGEGVLGEEVFGGCNAAGAGAYDGDVGDVKGLGGHGGGMGSRKLRLVRASRWGLLEIRTPRLFFLKRKTEE